MLDILEAREVSEFFTIIGRSAPCNEYMALFCFHSKKMLRLLFEYFVLIIEFCCVVLVWRQIPTFEISTLYDRFILRGFLSRIGSRARTIT